MQQEFPETSAQFLGSTALQNPTPAHQDGLHLHPSDPDSLDPSRQSCDSSVPGSAPGWPANTGDGGVQPGLLSVKLRRLNDHPQGVNARAAVPGQRISEYEKALTPASPPKALGFKVVRRAGSSVGGIQLADFPNEILTHVLSHLHPDSHAAVALVCKRFYALVTTPHAWRMAFQRYFQGQHALAIPSQPPRGTWDDDDDIIRSELRFFTRLTPHASWRSEYLLRTRLLRCLARGKPSSSSGGLGQSSRSSQSGKKASAVLTYNSKLPSPVTHLHASFVASSKKSLRVVHGATDVGVGSTSDPTTGRVEKWGLDDPFAFAQLDEVVPHIIPYGLGEGPTAVPNVIDVSQMFGLLGGEGFPGGRVFYRPIGEYRGKYLGQEKGVIEAHPDIPKIPELSEAISSVWIAKSSAVPIVTQTMIGILTGSSLGVVTAFSLGHDPSGPRYAGGEMTARWVLSPGVPIIAIQVDEQYSIKRRSMGRVLAVALNALGEVYYLTQPPSPLDDKAKSDDSMRRAWHAGRTTYWHLVESTRRKARSDDSGRNAIRGAYSPRSPSNTMKLKKEQMVAEAREIEKFLKYKPAHFRKVCHGWDMRRKIEVDFAHDDERGAGEHVVVINCGIEEDDTPSVVRLTRSITASSASNASELGPALSSVLPEDITPSLFGGGDNGRNGELNAISTAQDHVPVTDTLPESANAEMFRPHSGTDEWITSVLSIKSLGAGHITASCIDLSLHAVITSFEDPLKNSVATGSDVPPTPTSQSPLDIPGKRARLLAIGSEAGKILLWNLRGSLLNTDVDPLRVIQTESPGISALALSALYLVHGGSDGLVQAWDPLASSLDPIRTLNSRTTGRVPRHLMTINPALRGTSFSAVGAIFLDPDPAVLRGIVSFGTFIRYWSYSSSSLPAGRKRRLRRSDIHGHAGESLNVRRHGGGVQGYIAAETEELRLDQQHKAREEARLRSRFGVGLGDLTEEEALRYAEMMSQESYLLDEQRRTSASDTGSTADMDTASTAGSLDTVTPDPSIASRSPALASTSTQGIIPDDESDFELQVQQALRLSLLEGVNDAGQSPKGNSSGSYDFSIKVKQKRGKRTPSSSRSSGHTPMIQKLEFLDSPTTGPEADDELELALRLSLAEEESLSSFSPSPQIGGDEFPSLPGSSGKGKGKAL